MSDCVRCGEPGHKCLCNGTPPAPVTASDGEMRAASDCVCKWYVLRDGKASIEVVEAELAKEIAKHTRAADGDGVRRDAVWWSAALHCYEKNTTNERKLLESTIAALQAELAEERQQWKDSLTASMDESCDANTHHCACVPHLRAEVKQLTAELAECRQVRDDHHANLQLKKQELAERKAEADKVPIMVEQIIELHAIVDAARVYVRDSYAPDAEHDLARFEVLKAALAQVEHGGGEAFRLENERNELLKAFGILEYNHSTAYTSADVERACQKVKAMEAVVEAAKVVDHYCYIGGKEPLADCECRGCELVAALAALEKGGEQ